MDLWCFLKAMQRPLGKNTELDRNSLGWDGTVGSCAQEVIQSVVTLPELPDAPDTP